MRLGAVVGKQMTSAKQQVKSFNGEDSGDP